MSVMLSAYDYTLVYKPGKLIAEALRQMLLQMLDCAVPSPTEVLMLESLHDQPLKSNQVEK